MKPFKPISFMDEDEDSSIPNKDYFEKGELLEREREETLALNNILEGNIFDYDGAYEEVQKEKKKRVRFIRNLKRKRERREVPTRNIKVCIYRK